MQYLILFFFLPACYLGYLSYKWLYKKVSKKDRIHRTRKALPILLLLLLAPIVPDYIAFGALNASEKQSFWLYGLIFFIFLDLIVFLSFVVIKVTNTRKNISKFLITLIYTVVIISAVWWSASAFSLGLYQGRFGISKKQAIDIVEKHLGAGVNHSYVSARKSAGHWLVTESENTRDSSAKTEMVYFVNRADGTVSRSPGLNKIHLNATKNNGQPAQEVEIIVLSDKSMGKNEQGEWQNSEYDISDDGGSADVWLENDSNHRYHMQVRDCATICTNYYFKFNFPLKENYDVILNQMQSGVTEL